MKLKFCGAARQVTGSCHLLTLEDGFTILLDCGLFQGHGKNSWEENNRWFFDPSNIDCLILSHAHIDHSGRIPKLVRDGFKGSIYSTHATRSLCSIMLLDSAKIQERDVFYYNKKLLKKRRRVKKSAKIRTVLYTSKDITPTMNLFASFSYGKWFPIHHNVEVMFRDAGHILGSANVNIRINENGKNIFIGFTGDIGRPDRPILRDPKTMIPADFLICESTYGDKEHELPPAQVDKFLTCIKETCIDKKGKLIIPAFSVGRTQEIIYMLDQLESQGLLPRIPVYIDSPLAVNATQVFGSHPECFDDDLNEYMLTDEDPFGFNSLNYIQSVEESKALNNSQKPAVIISASGMMNAGRIRHHMFNNLENPNSCFLIVGYCSPDTAGGILRKGVETLKIFGEVKQVRAKIETMDSFSAHGDRKEMYQFIKNHKEKNPRVFLTHGEYDTQIQFKDYLEERNFKNVEIPEIGSEFSLH